MSKPTIYHGTVGSLREVREACGPELPKGAKVWFAYGFEKLEPNMNPRIEDDMIRREILLVWFTFNKRVFSLVGGRELFDNFEGIWKYQMWEMTEEKIAQEQDRLKKIEEQKAWSAKLIASYRGMLTNMLDLIGQWNIGIPEGETVPGPFRGKVERS